jgi:methyl-accepting chemotaxis protein
MFSTIFIGVALPLTISIFLINFTETRINGYVLSRNQNSLQLAKKSLELFLQRQLNLTNSFTYNKSVIEADPFEMRLFFIRVQRDFPIFKSIRLYNFDDLSRPLFSTSPDLRDHKLDLLPDAKATLAAQKHYISRVVINENIEPIFLVHYPVVRFGQTSSVLVCEVDLKYIWNLVDNINFGKYGHTFLLTTDGKLIAHQDKTMIIGDKKIPINIDTSVLFGASNYKDVNGNDVVGLYEKIEGVNWYLVIEQEVDEARDLALEMRFNMLFYLTISLIIAIAVGIGFSRRISRPIEELTRGVKNFGQGLLLQQIVVDSNDELQDLADEFNRMSKTLYYNQKKLRRIERISAMTKFVRMVSHEIRNPLNSMNINMQILRREVAKKEPDIEKLIRFLDVITSEITRMDDLISNYTMIAQTPQLDIQIHNIHSIVQSVLLMHRAEAEAKNIEIHEYFIDEIIRAQVDSSQLKQVLINLILNAFQAMH